MAKKNTAYVAIKIEHLSASTDIVPCTAKCDMHIQGENGASVDLKAGERFFLHRAGSLGENMFYVVRQVSGCKRCSCPARKPCCKHEIAIIAYVARREAAVAPAKQREAIALTDLAVSIFASTQRATAPLQPKAFSVLK